MIKIIKSLILVAFLFSTALGQDLIRKAPYLIYTGHNTEMKVNWQLYSSSTCLLEWGPDTTYSGGSAETDEYGDDHQHTFTITQLTPETQYYYRLTVGQEIQKGSFRTAPPTGAARIKFFVYGDTRSNPGIHDEVAHGMVDDFTADSSFQSLIFSTGDLVSNGNNESDWDNQFFNPAYTNIQTMLHNVPYQAAMGNHEGSGVLFVKYFSYPFVSHRYWSFNYGPAHFVIVDQYTDYTPGSAQYHWIVEDLSLTSKRWKFIILHEPGWSAGHHENNPDVQDYIQPLCEQYGVSILFAGHNHYYARAIVNGVQHITTGGGGAPLYTPNPNYPNIVATNMTNHFCKVVIDSSQLYFEAVKPDGTVIDTFSITLEPTAVEDEGNSGQIKTPQLVEYPNPFNASADISFNLDKEYNVRLDVYNLIGQKVKSLIDSYLEPGHHTAVWDASDFSSGIYFYKLTTGDEVFTKRMTLLK